MKLKTLHWRPCIDDAVQELSDNPEHSGDPVLVAMARIAQVAQDAARVISSLSGDAAGKGLPILHVKPLQSSLEHVRNYLSPEILRNS